MKTVALIGTGRLGTSLGIALADKGYQVTALADRSKDACRESLSFIGQGEVFTDNNEAASQGRLVFLTVPDDAIAQAAAELASSSQDWSQKYVFHCSGLLSSQVLDPLREKGAQTASLHPMQTFADKNNETSIFKGIYFGIEGTPQASAQAQKIVQALGGCSLNLKPEEKPLYHAACSMASNSLAALLDAAISLLNTLVDNDKKAAEMLFPLIQGTLQNVKEFDTTKALTGPIKRGDVTTLKKHLEVLRAYPEQREIYLHLAKAALEIAGREGGLSPQKLKEIQALLEDT
jgi:predicted short-subunit dehydrogenase-like oxidoreductase (DUF2520 family)